MTSEAVNNTEAAEAAGDEPTRELREHLDFQRTQTRRLRARCTELSHELALTRRLLANLLPLAGEGWPEVTAAVRLPAVAPVNEGEGLRFSLDELDRGPTRTFFRGWAFAPGLADCARAATTLLFVPAGDLADPARLPHAATTRPLLRPDVAAAFAGLTPAPARLDCAGFEATVMDLSVAPGEYELVLQVSEPGSLAVSQSTRVLLRF